MTSASTKPNTTLPSGPQTLTMMRFHQAAGSRLRRGGSSPPPWIVCIPVGSSWGSAT